MQTAELKGLSPEEVSGRLEKFGLNTLITTKPKSIFSSFLNGFKNPLIILLLIAAAISLATGSFVSGVLIIVIIFVSIILDFVISYKSQKAAFALAATVSPKTKVIRSGTIKVVAHEEIVPDDLIVLEAGSIVPSDGVVLQSETMYANEAALTGESLPVEKDVGAEVYMGSGVVSGEGVMKATLTASRTKFASLVLTLSQKERPSEFESGIKKFSLLLMRVILVLVILIFLINAYLKHDIFTSLIFSLALAVGLTPDLLPVIIAVNLSRASLRMSKKGVIVKKLSAIENFGSMNVLCTDKTGTLTQGTIVLVKYLNAQGESSTTVLEAAYVSSILKGTIKTPLDEAVVAHQEFKIDDYTKIAEIPFDFERRRDTLVVSRKNQESLLLITKGAPEEIFKVCLIDQSTQNQAQNIFDQLSQEGFRVIAVATKEVSNQQIDFGLKDEAKLNFAGFIGFIDPPKADVHAVLTEIKNKSIEIKVITGDHALVAEHILRDVGLESKGTLDSIEIEKLPDEALRIKVEQVTLFSRVTPIQKNRIIRALQAAGHTVGYLGDGINDAPALKSADVGISVENAVDVAKASADIVLTNKSLTPLLQGIKEGRKTFANTKKYITMAVSSNFGNTLSMTGAAVFLPFLPMLPTQILLNNLLYEVAQISLITDHVDEQVLNHPNPWNVEGLKRFMVVFGLLSSLFDFIIFYLLYKVFSLGEGGFQTAWFMQSFFSQVFAVFFLRTIYSVWKVRRPHRLVIWSAFLTTFVTWFIALSQLGKYFGFRPLPLVVIISIIGVSLVYFVSIEIVKKFFFKKERTLN